MFVVIYGRYNSEKMIGHGEFFCPICQKRTSYMHVQTRPYLTVFIIPLIPVGTSSRFVECLACEKSFDEEIINRTDVPPEFAATKADLAVARTADRKMNKELLWIVGGAVVVLAAAIGFASLARPTKPANPNPEPGQVAK